MFQRFHDKLKDREEGFTLIELLVVILIIAILAAIAIPVFLSQREKGWVSQAESALKNAATAQESYLVSEGEYAATIDLLEGAGTEGFNQTEDATVTVVSVDTAKAYCLTVNHANLDEDYFYNSATGLPTDVACT